MNFSTNFYHVRIFFQKRLGKKRFCFFFGLTSWREYQLCCGAVFQIDRIIEHKLRVVSAKYLSTLLFYFLAVELISPESRVWATFIINCAYTVGDIFLGVVGYYYRYWRYFLLIIYLPGVLFISYFWWARALIKYIWTFRTLTYLRRTKTGM